MVVTYGYYGGYLDTLSLSEWRLFWRLFGVYLELKLLVEAHNF